MTERLHFHFSLSCIEEGNGNPLQCSCLENPGDGGAWWAALSGIAQSRIRLKWLSSSSSSSRALNVHPWWLSGKESTYNVGDSGNSGSIPKLGRSPGGGNGNPFQDSCLENPMNRGAWQAPVHEVTKSWIQLKWLSTTQHGIAEHWVESPVLYSRFLLSILHIVSVVYACPSQSPNSSHLLCPALVSMFAFYVCASICVLQIRSSICGIYPQFFLTFFANII